MQIDPRPQSLCSRPYSSVYLFHIYRHKNCMFTTKIIVRRLHWYFRALWTLLFISGVHNQTLMYTTECWLDKFYIWIHKWSFLLKWRLVYTVALTAWFLCTSESLRWIFSVPKSSHGILLCTQEYKMHYCLISFDFFDNSFPLESQWPDEKDILKLNRDVIIQKLYHSAYLICSVQIVSIRIDGIHQISFSTRNF